MPPREYRSVDEDLFWRAAAAVARREGHIADLRIEHELTSDIDGLFDRRRDGYRVTVTLYVDRIGSDAAPQHMLEELATAHPIAFGRQRPVPTTTPPAPTPPAAHPSPTEERVELDDAALRFSLLELDEED